MAEELVGPFEDEAQFTDYKIGRERQPPPAHVERVVQGGQTYARVVLVSADAYTAPALGVVAGAAAAGAAAGALAGGAVGAATGAAASAVLGAVLGSSASAPATSPGSTSVRPLAVLPSLRKTNDMDVSRGGPYIASTPETWLHKAVGTGQCVAYVQTAAAAPHTSNWRQGAKVKGNEALVRGTAIATFDPNGTYGNHTDGRSHAAIYLSQDEHGLTVIDQWVGQRVHQRLIRFDGRLPVNDGNMFYAIL